MRLLHPAAWAGFFLNCVLILVLFASLSEPVLSQLDDQQRAIMQLMASLRSVVFGILLLQAVGLALLVMRKKSGLVLGCLGGALMMPAGILFIIGCILSHYNIRYSHFFPAPPGYAGARTIFRSDAVRRFWSFTGAGLCLSFLLFSTGLADFSMLVLGLALAAAYLAMRVNNQHPLALFATHLALAPAVMARRIALPYEVIRGATLFPDSSIRFDVETPDGPASLSWSLLSIEKKDQRAALEALAEVLTAHNVPLQ